MSKSERGVPVSWTIGDRSSSSMPTGITTDVFSTDEEQRQRAWEMQLTVAPQPKRSSKTSSSDALTRKIRAALSNPNS